MLKLSRISATLTKIMKSQSASLEILAVNELVILAKLKKWWFRPDISPLTTLGTVHARYRRTQQTNWMRVARKRTRLIVARWVLVKVYGEVQNSYDADHCKCLAVVWPIFLFKPCLEEAKGTVLSIIIFNFKYCDHISWIAKPMKVFCTIKGLQASSRQELAFVLLT